MIDLWAGLTDVLLVASCVAGVVAIGPARARAASFGLALVGAAALLGVVEFLWLPSAKRVHDLATALAGGLGVPMLGLGVLAAVFPTIRVLPLTVALVVAVILFGRSPLYAQVVGGWALVLAALAGARWTRDDPARGRLVIAGALGAAVSGLALNGDGSLLGLSRLGWFHVAFAASMAALGAALRR